MTTKGKRLCARISAMSPPDSSGLELQPPVESTFARITKTRRANLRVAIMNLAKEYGQVEVQDGIVRVYPPNRGEQYWDFTVPMLQKKRRK